MKSPAKWPSANRRHQPTKGRLPGSLFFCITILLFLGGCASVGPTDDFSELVTIEGLVSLEGKGYKGANVSLYPLAEFTKPGEPAHLTQTESKESGVFLLKAPAGDYLITARSHSGDLFAFFGRNPLRAGAHQRGLTLPLVPAHPPIFLKNETDTSIITGRVLHQGNPVAGAKVALYLSAEAGFRGQPYDFSAPTDKDGKFSMIIDPGSYFATVKMRASGRDIGPLKPGDLFGIAPGLRMTIERGVTVNADIELLALPSREKQARFLTKFATVEGTVTDATGAPQAGMRAALYENKNMLGEPLLLSEPTGPDGKFNISTSLTGKLYLGVREFIGGPPSSGERVGFADGPDNGRFNLTPGVNVEGVKIIARLTP
ncbi:MAG: hypothetical protein C0608_08250 [Deltaproteobacteria bacterium]|nr:MAG: hypothetical protein C0608_08250 [Deltaproteobacteria bacterium]